MESLADPGAAGHGRSPISPQGQHTSRDETAVVHGDFRLDNTIVDVTGQGRIAAVLDWELSTLGDPLADLGLLLTYWHDRDDDERAQIAVAAGITTRKGFPTADQLAHRYASMAALDELPFYSALGAMKLAVILEGVHARHLTGTTVSDGYNNVGSAVPILVARGFGPPCRGALSHAAVRRHRLTTGSSRLEDSPPASTGNWIPVTYFASSDSSHTSASEMLCGGSSPTGSRLRSVP